MIKQNPAKWIAVTAMGVALVVVAQFLGSRIPSIATIFGPFSVQQLITGTLVNCILLVFTARAGIASGAVIGVLSSLLAAFFGKKRRLRWPKLPLAERQLAWTGRALLLLLPVLAFVLVLACAATIGAMGLSL